MTDQTDPLLRDVLADVLGLDAARVATLASDSPLLGALPELDSMAIATLFGAIEDRLGVLFADDDLSGETLETYGSLLALVEARRGA